MPIIMRQRSLKDCHPRPLIFRGYVSFREGKGCLKNILGCWVVSSISHHAFLLYILRILWVNPPYPKTTTTSWYNKHLLQLFVSKATWHQQTSWNCGDHPETCWLMGIPKSKHCIPFQTTWLPDVLKIHRISPFQRHRDLLIWKILDQKGLHLCQNFVRKQRRNLRNQFETMHLPTSTYYQDLLLGGYMWVAFAASPRCCCDKTLPRLLPSSESSASIAPSWGWGCLHQTGIATLTTPPKNQGITELQWRNQTIWRCVS